MVGRGLLFDKNLSNPGPHYLLAIFSAQRSVGIKRLVITCANESDLTRFFDGFLKSLLEQV